MRSRLFVGAASLLTLTLTARAPLGADQAPVPPAQAPAEAGRGGGTPIDPAAADRGRAVYVVQCAACHGADGRGGPEANTSLIASPIVSASDTGTSLAAFLKVGRPERRMPPVALTDEQAADVWVFLRTLAPAGAAGRAGGRGRGFSLEVVGDAKAGEAYFATQGCTNCHSVTGDLKGIGSRLDPPTIQGRLVMPRGNGGYPPSFLAPPPPTEAQRTVTITPPSGPVLTGTLLWITDFDVTFVDAAGVRRSITRRDDVPKVEVHDPVAWHVDHMKRLKTPDMHNLTAYLVTLK